MKITFEQQRQIEQQDSEPKARRDTKRTPAQTALPLPAPFARPFRALPSRPTVEIALPASFRLPLTPVVLWCASPLGDDARVGTAGRPFVVGEVFGEPIGEALREFEPLRKPQGE